MDNLYTVILPSAGGVLLIIILSAILSVTTRKRRMNKGWEDAIEAVAYVTKTGLTLAYIPYSPDLFEDEQLFGGALTGIVSILGEITGETELEKKAHVMEYGDKRLIICSGYFGNAILLVNDVKPILRELLVQFLDDFEVTYKFSLAQELVDLNEFASAPLLAESIFGFRKNIVEQVQPLEFDSIDRQDYVEPEEHQETTIEPIEEPIYDSTDEISQEITEDHHQDSQEENRNYEFRDEEY